MIRTLPLALAFAACGVRAPSPVDVGALLAARGPIEGHRDLELQIVAHPRDVQARLALAELDERTGRPGEALQQLEVVLTLGGPLGTRWHASDRARMGRLLLARGQLRIARGAASALADLERAAAFGATPAPAALVRARELRALAQLHHVDAGERAQARARLASLADPRWVGARAGATPAEHGAFGASLWTLGARREAYEQLAAWHAATPAPRDPGLQAAYLRALAWWSPVWLGQAPLPPADDLVGPERCLFPRAGCELPGDDPPPVAVAIAVPIGKARAVAAAVYAHAHVPGAPPVDALLGVASAFGRDPAHAERLGRELVAAAVDEASAHAAAGALFDALGDPARARAEWQAAVDHSPEPAYVRGLAEAAARGGDASAAMIHATLAAAAWGDPATVWLGLARVLDAGGLHVDALQAARTAIELAGPHELAGALAVAEAASRALGRGAQADELARQAAPLAHRLAKPDPADPAAAIAAYRALPTAGTVAHLWVASRAHPREVALRIVLASALAADDPRRPMIVRELVALAADPDSDRAFTAATAFR